ncbi:MAG: Crp/Fnr family transcriptional regulator [Chloroflexota bacterium]|nr:Crp/Fnr family transcriptional regulator [Chloroflexota bacterium]
MRRSVEVERWRLTKAMSKADAACTAAQVLSAASYFAELDPATLEAVARSATQRKYETGQVVFWEGEPCAGLYVVQEGWLKVVKLSVDGREQVLRVVGAGETFGEMGVFAANPNPATAIALEPATVWIIQRDAMLQLLDRRPAMARVILQNMAERVLHLVTLVEDLSLRTVEARLARHLLERATAGTLHRRRWATQAEMAARLGTVLVVLNRALHGLATEGLIEVERHQIRIVDREGLEARAMLNE